MALDDQVPGHNQGQFEGRRLPVYNPTAMDPFFNELSDQLADRGFFTAPADALINWARTGS
ncbi:MAG: hypothetical protein KDA46_11105, partial [Parvularculaceae bacterium]|nr:hypothetical protein [Parvularculaceae bacterium]